MIKIRKVEKAIFIPISAGLLYLPFSIIRKYSDEVKNHFIIYSLCSSMGMILSIIPLLISKINMNRAISKNKLISKESRKSNFKITLIYHIISEKKIKRFKFVFISLSSLLDCLQTILATITYNENIEVN